MSSSKNILSQEQQFKLYLEGELSESEILNFQKAIENNPFYKDAFEGYQNNVKGIQSLPKLKANKEQFSSLNFASIFYTLFIILSITIGCIYVLNMNPVNPIVLKEVTELPLKTKEHKKPLIAPKPIQELTDENIDQSELKTKEQQVQVISLVLDHSKSGLDTVELKESSSTSIELQKVTQLPLKKIKNNIPKEIETESVPLIALHGLINVNYSKIETNFKFEKTVFTYSGLPANKEGDKKENLEPSHKAKIEYIAYDKYLGDIQYYFTKNNFKKALKGYKKILIQHPSDINAHFYSAICYYNINQSSKALEHLDAVLNHQYATFRQEGEWYKAQVLYDLGRKEEALIMLNKIIARNDFYAAQAIGFKEKIKSNNRK